MRELILRHAAGAVTTTAVPGLVLYRSDGPEPATVSLIYTPMVCVMAQGQKEVVLGRQTFRYTPAEYLMSSVDLPVRGTALRAAPGRPYLSMSVALQPALLGEMLMDMPCRQDGEPACGLAVGRLDEPLLECFVRLLRLLDHPEDVRQLAPLMTREIHYRMLRGGHGGMLRQAVDEYGRTAKVTQAIRWLRGITGSLFRRNSWRGAFT